MFVRYPCRVSKYGREIERRSAAMRQALGVLEEVRRQRESCNRRESDAVRLLRFENVSWLEIGRALGVNPETLRRRYGAMDKGVWVRDV